MKGLRDFCIWFLVVLCCSLCSGQVFAQYVISGRVVSDNEPAIGAYVTEVDKDNRVMNQTSTDADGYYTMKVTRGTNRIMVKAEGFRPFVEPMRGRNKLNVELIPRSTMADAELLDKKYPVTDSYNLFYGLFKGRAVPQYVRVGLLNDSMFILVPPVHSNGTNEIYPAENMMVFVDAFDRHIMSGITPRDAYTLVGRPEDIDSKIILTQKGWMIDDERSEMRGDVNTYPQFVFSMKRLKHMLEGDARPARILIETAAKDNYWVLYPADDYEKEFLHIFNKLQKKLKKSKSKNR